MMMMWTGDKVCIQVFALTGCCSCGRRHYTRHSNHYSTWPRSHCHNLRPVPRLIVDAFIMARRENEATISPSCVFYSTVTLRMPTTSTSVQFGSRFLTLTSRLCYHLLRSTMYLKKPDRYD